MKIVTIHAHDSANAEMCKVPNTEWYHLVNEKNSHRVWGGGSRPKPDNVFPLEYENLTDIDWFKYDICIVQSLDRYEFLKHVPIPKIWVEHTLPYPLFNGAIHSQLLQQDKLLKKLVFLSEEQVMAWRIQNPFEVEVIPSCINVDEYDEWQGNEATILTAVNDLRNRNWCVGYDVWQMCTKGLPRTLIGDNSNIPKNDLYEEYPTEWNKFNRNDIGFFKGNESRQYFINSACYFNSNLHSTLPYALMEAMAHGMPIVSTNRNTARLYLESAKSFHKAQSGILSNIPVVLRTELVKILNDPQSYKEMGQAARTAAREFFDCERFVAQWQGVLEEVAG